MYKNGLISPQDNFTAWKGIIQNSTFDNRMFDSTSDNFKDIKEDLEIAMNFLIMNQNITYIEAKDSKVILKRTDDCQIAFTLVLPWNAVNKLNKDFSKEVKSYHSYHGSIGDMYFDQFATEDFCPTNNEFSLYKASFSLTDVKLRHEPTWKSQMTDILQHILRSLFKRKFGEMFYKVVILDYIDHTKGVLVEAGVMLDPNSENRKDIETIFEEQKGFLMDLDREKKNQSPKCF